MGNISLYINPSIINISFIHIYIINNTKYTKQSDKELNTLLNDINSLSL